jgi:DNA repair protein RadA/Sms
VAAIVSSYRNLAIRSGTVVFGEVGLAGEVRGTSQPQIRIREAASLGFERCLVPVGCVPKTDLKTDIEVIPVRSVQESMEVLFT